MGHDFILIIFLCGLVYFFFLLSPVKLVIAFLDMENALIFHFLSFFVIVLIKDRVLHVCSLYESINALYENMTPYVYNKTLVP